MKKKYLVCLMTAAMLLGGCGSATSSQAPEPSASSVTESQTSSLPAASVVQPDTGSTEAPTTTDSRTAESTTETSQATADVVPVDAETWSIIQQYGFVNSQDDRNQAGQMSDLSYALKSDTLKDEGDYYTIQADISRKVEIPADLKAGDKVTITLNELTGQTDELTMGDNGTLTGTEGNEYYYFDDTAKDGKVVLYEDSDDRVDDVFYSGTLCISKDAVSGAAIEQKPYETITKDTLTDDPWFNGMYFDDRGVVVQLIFYGD